MPVTRSSLTQLLSRAAPLVVLLGLAGCGVASKVIPTPDKNTGPPLRPHVVEPVTGKQVSPLTGPDPEDIPVGDVNAHAPPLSEVKAELKMEYVATHASRGTYIDPLRYVTNWGRTDQGVDATMSVGAPILAPCNLKILAVIPDWFEGQPFIYFELLNGPDAGQVQYVAEEITDLAPVGTLSQGQPIARYAPSGTAIEYGWATPEGQTLAAATTGYVEGEQTPAGKSMRAWLNSLGAGAGPDHS